MDDQEENLKQPLLQKEPENSLNLKDKTLIGTIWVVASKASYLVLASLGNAIKSTITFVFIGRFSGDKLTFAAIGLGMMLMNVFLRS